MIRTLIGLVGAIALTLWAVRSGSALSAPPGPLAPPEAKLAFPGAEGHGRFAAGGRDGRIIAVTSLDDAGPGTLRACMTADGPRVCVFRVAGIIRFVGERPVIRNPYLTIAGETAPAPGILVTHSGGPSGFTPIIVKKTHDIVIRHIRVRTDLAGDERASNDAFSFENAQNVIFDHVSGAWARDELIGGQGQNDRITISWSIFAEGLPRHDKCALLANDPTGPQNVSFLNNLCAHNGDRNPDVNFTPGSCVEIVNNVFYNGGSEFAEVWESYGGTPVSFVGNVFKAGPSTHGGAAAIARKPKGSKGPARIFAQDNLVIGDLRAFSEGVEDVIERSPVCPLTVDPIPAAEAQTQVLAQAGALPRDAFDARIAAEARDTAGSIVQTPGALMPVAAGQPYPDADADGMSDDFERAHGSDPFAPDAWEDADGDGWLNLEEFLDARHKALISTAAVQTP